MKRKIGAVLLAGAMACTMAAGLSGCVGHIQADFEMPEGGFDVDTPITITFHTTMGQNLTAVVNTVLESFNKLYPNITVEVSSPAGDYDTLRSKISTQLLTNANPDVAYCYPDHVALYNSYDAVQSLNDFLPGGAYADYTVKEVKLDESGNAVTDASGNYEYVDAPLAITQAQKDAFNPNYFNEGYEFGDGTLMYTLPWIKSTEVMFYNKDFIEKNIADHPDLKIPETWDDMEKFCAAVKEIDDTLYPFTYDSEANWFITMCEQYGSGYTQIEGEGGHYIFDNETNRNWLLEFADWRSKGYFTTQILNGNTYTSNLFTSQKSVICVGSTGGTSYQTDTSGETEPFEVGIAPIPQLKPYSEERADYDATYKPKMISQGPSVCIFKNDDPQKVLASWLFVKYFTTSVDFQARFSKESGYMPVLTLDTMKTNRVYKDFIENPGASVKLKSNAVKTGMEYASAYFVSPAFNGSSTAREQVGALLAAVVERPEDIDKQFKDALDKCNYAT